MSFGNFIFHFRYLKGYKKLVFQDNLSFLPIIIDDLVKTKIKNENIFLKFDKKLIDLITAQYLKYKLLNLHFNKKILSSLHTGKSISYPLPYEWRLTLEAHGIKANTRINSIIWFFYCLKMFIIGIVTFFFNSLYTFKISLLKFEYKKNYIYFDSLVYDCIPSATNSKNIITWYSNWIDKQGDVHFYCHNVKNTSYLNDGNINLKFINNSLVPLDNIYQFFKFLVWNILFLVKSFFYLFKGSFLNLIFSREIIKSSNFLFANKDVLAKDYLFHNSSHVYRPIWTYFAEKKGSRILFYFYSTNFTTLNFNTQKYIQENTWFLCTWSNYLVWDIYSANFINNNIKSYKNNIKIVGPIMFSFKYTKQELPNSKYIVIFDVQPFRESFYCSLGVIHRYYRAEISIKFFMDIIQVCRRYDYQIVIKQKRKVGNLICNKYVDYLKSIKNNVYIADENCDISNLIPNAKAVISMPFTSTSIWAKFLNVKTIFYDTTGELKFNNDDSHGIDVINSFFDLEKWVKNL